MSPLKDRIRKNYEDLCKDMKGKEISIRLYALEILDKDDKERINGRDTKRDQNEELLDLVDRGGPKAIEAFYEALEEFSPHLANLLENDPGEPQVSTVPCKYDLVGRHELCEMLVNIVLDGTQQRLVILTAPPGFGKSAVAMKVTHMLLDNDVRVLYHCLRKASSLAAVASSILKNLGISVVGIREPVCQAVQYLKQCEQSTVLVLDNAEDLLDDRNERDFKKFLEVITCHAPKVHTLVTTRIAIEGLQLALDILRVKKTVLPPLDPEESKEFLMLYLGLSNHKESEAKLLGKLCGGVPLLMQLTASVIHEGTSISSLAKELQFSPKRVLQNARNPDFELYYQDLELFMKQLPPGIQDALHCLSVFPASFSRSEARMLFTGDCWQYESTMSQLCSYGLIQKVTDCEKMSVHPLVQAFCKASHGQSRSKYSEAIKKFIVKYLEILRDANTRFVSTDCKHALEQYELNEDNIKHALKSAAEDEHMKVPGITVSTEVVSFLAKVMHMEEFLQIYEGFQGVAQDMDLKKHQAACLTSIGFKQLCYNGRCSTKEARETLTKALQFWKNEGLPSQEELAHCLSKLGLCLVRDGEEEEGVQKMAEAIIIRKQLVRARGGITERMLLGGSYCDLGMALFTTEKYRAAVNVWCNLALVRYQELLRNHPFTANLLRYIGEAYFKLQQFPLAVEFKRKSLVMLKSILPENHPDTARAYCSLGCTLKAQMGHKVQLEALEMLEKAKSIQVRVHASDADVKNTQDAIKVLRDVNASLRNCHISY